jgi:hypothetical protein
MPVTLTAEEIQACEDILADYKDIQFQGAGETGSDDFIVARKRVQDLVATDPPTPLRIPLGGDVNRPVRDRVFDQASDNGIMPIFLGLIRYLSDRYLVTTRVEYAAAVSDPDTSYLMSNPGSFLHSTGPTESGVPVEATLSEANYVVILSESAMAPLVVAGGLFAGERIFGRTVASGSTSPDSVTVEFRSAPIGADATVAGNPYTWEIGQPGSVNLYYGFRQNLLELDESAFRRVLR